MNRRRLNSVERGNRTDWILGGIIVALIGLVTAMVVGFTDAGKARSALSNEQARELACIATWANTYAARADKRDDADRQRLAALDTLARALAHAGPAQWRAAVDRYLAASDRYARRIAAQPLPPSPRFLCDHLAGVLPSPTVVTLTPAPSTVVRTVRPPAATVTAPGPTRTVRAPAPPRTTRTVVRPGPTVTVHPAPPSRPCVLGLFCR